MNIRFKRITAAALCIGTLLTAASCAETPAEDIVVNKGDNNIRDKIENSVGSPENNGLSGKTDTQEAITFTSDNGAVTYNIEAQVAVPDKDIIPVFRAAPHYFTPEEIEKIARSVFGDADIYEYNEILTKQQLQNLILEKKREIGDRDALLEHYGGNEENAERYINMCEEQIAAMEEDMENAPEESVQTLSDFQYHPDDYYVSGNSNEYLSASHVSNVSNGSLSVKAMANIDGIPYQIRAAKRDDTARKASNISIYPGDITSLATSYGQTTEFTEEETKQAISIVEKALDDMDIGELVIEGYYYTDNTIGDQITRYSMIFECVPTYEGVKHKTVYSPVNINEEYAPNYDNTSLVISVSDGRIMTVTYMSPIEIVSTENENVEIMSYDEAMENIQKQLKLTWTSGRITSMCLNTTDDRYKATEAQLKVNKLEFVLFRTQIMDNPDEFYLVPAWILYGSYDMQEYEYNGQKYEMPSMKVEGEILSELSEPLMVLNAIDGSVIDMSQGY